MGCEGNMVEWSIVRFDYGMVYFFRGMPRYF